MKLKRAALVFGGSLSRFIVSALHSSSPWSFPSSHQTRFYSTMPMTRRQTKQNLAVPFVLSSLDLLSVRVQSHARRSLTTSLDMVAESEDSLPRLVTFTSQEGKGDDKVKSSSSSSSTPSTPTTKKSKLVSTITSPRKRKQSAISEPNCVDPLTPTVSTNEQLLPPTSRKRTNKPKVGSVKPPEGWEHIYSLVEELRQDKSAPVDNDGGEALPQRDLGDKVYRFQVLVALMLSSQTKDAVVGEAIRGLQIHGLTVENISATSPEKLNELIRRVGFHNNKTKYIKEVAEVLITQYDGDIPGDAEEMMKLSGVGPKMAFIVENIAWNRCSGIGVDTHMHRMFNELKWVTTKNPEQTRIQLEAWLPRDKWTAINYLWVGFGQEVQQFKPKLLQKALVCSRPAEALKLIKRLGLDYNKEGAKLGVAEKVQEVLTSKTNGVKTHE